MPCSQGNETGARPALSAAGRALLANRGESRELPAGEKRKKRKEELCKEGKGRMEQRKKE